MVIVRDEKGFVRFKPMTESTSTQDGGDRANDEFLKLLPTLFGKFFKVVMATATNDAGVTSEFRFKQKFMASFESQKKQPSKGPTDKSRMANYTGVQNLTKGNNGTSISWQAKRIQLPTKDILACIKKPVKDIVAPDGPLRAHLDKTKAKMGDVQPELLFSGGGSVDEIFQKAVRRFVGEGIAFQTVAHAAQSLVAGGIILNILDTDVCNDEKISNKSYGIVYNEIFDPKDPIHRARADEAVPVAPHMAGKDMKGKKELPDTVVWKARTNAPMRQRSDVDVRRMQQTIYSCHPKDHKGGWDMEISTMETEDPTLALEDGHNCETKGILEADIWKIHISKPLATKIARKIDGSIYGFVQHEGSQEWQLDFDYELHYRWAGMLQFFEVHIPYGGFFPQDGGTLGPDKKFVARYRLTGDCKVAADAGNDMDWVKT